MRGHKWRLTRNEFARIVARECVYCGAKPKRRFFTRKKARTESKERVNGVDRVANAKGYTPANSVACCTRCNSFKSDFELKEFLRHVTRIAKYTRRLR